MKDSSLFSTPLSADPPAVGVCSYIRKSAKKTITRCRHCFRCACKRRGIIVLPASWWKRAAGEAAVHAFALCDADDDSSISGYSLGWVLAAAAREEEKPSDADWETCLGFF